MHWAVAPALALDSNGPRDVDFRAFDESWIERPALETFAEVAARYPDNIACEDIASRFTFAEVWSASRRLAATIDAVVAPGKPVGVLLPNQASYPIAVLACLGAARPCVLIDRNYPQDRVGRIVNDAGLSAVVLKHSDIAGGYLLPAGVRALDLEDALGDRTAPEKMPALPSPPDAAAFIVYTSGSTGSPKGIVLSQRGVLHRAAELVNAVHLRPDDKVLSLASPGTIGGLQQIFEVMLSGASLVKLDLQLVGLGQVVRAVAERRISMMFSTPAVWRSVARLRGAKDALVSLRCVQSSGDTLLTVDYELIRAVLPSNCHVLSVYGATEAPALLQWFVDSPPPDEVRVPAGYPLPGFDFAVLDEGGRPAMEGMPGEFVIRSRYTSLGVWQNGAVNPGAFDASPDAPDTKIYRTGDLVRRRSDGLYVVLGRRDRQVKIRGNRVELAEIETAMRRMPGIADAAVVACLTGQEPLLLGFVVPRAATRGVVDQVRRHLAATLPAYMRPREIFSLPSLPLLPGRKIDEDALLEHAARGGIIESKVPAPFDPPGQRAWQMVDQAWRAAIGRPPPKEQVSFEDAGGDSLQLLQLIFELERLAERPLPMERFHGRLSVLQFAAELDACLAQAAEVMPPDMPAIFLFPPAGGGDAYLTAFRAACAALVPVRQVRYPDLRAFARADASFESITAYAVGQIEDLKPEGALVLAGYSDGGDAAYEAARQLRAKGREVTRLLVLDTDASGLAYPAPAAGDRPVRPLIGRYFRRPTTHHYRRLVEMLVPERLLRTAKGRAMLGPALALRLPLPAGIAFIAALKAYSVLFDEHHRRWSADLRPEQLGIPIVLFRSEESRPGAPRDLGWASRTRELTIVPVPGNHSTMLADERALAIAARFAELAGQRSR